MNRTIQPPTTGATMGEWASFYVEAFGWALTPLKPRKKRPYLPSWQEEHQTISTRDQALAHWRSSARDGMGLVHAYSGTVAIDIDHWEAARTALEAVGVSLDEVAAAGAELVGNPEGRGKALFRAPEGLELQTLKLQWPGQENPKKKIMVLELRGHGGQDVLPPSIHPGAGEPYRWIRAPWEIPGGLPELPASMVLLWQNWDAMAPKLEAACPWAPAPEPRRRTRSNGNGSSRRNGSSRSNGNRPSPKERARAWLAKRDPAIKGSRGHDWTYITACDVVRGFDLPDSQALEILLEWNATCQPPWKSSELEGFISRAREKAKGEPGYLLEEDRDPPANGSRSRGSQGPEEEPPGWMDDVPFPGDDNGPAPGGEPAAPPVWEQPGLLEQAARGVLWLESDSPGTLAPKARSEWMETLQLAGRGGVIPLEVRPRFLRLVRQFSEQLLEAGLSVQKTAAEEKAREEAQLAARKQRALERARQKAAKVQKEMSIQQRAALKKLETIFAGAELREPFGLPPLPQMELKGDKLVLSPQPPAVLARYLDTALHWLHHAGALWLYRDGCYRPGAEQLVRAAVQAIDGTEAYSKRGDEAVYWLKTARWQEPKGVDASPLVNVQNGLLDPLTGELHPHSPEHLSTIQLPVKWDPNAYHSRTNAFLDEVMPEDGGATRAVLEEAMGYTLLPDCRHERAVMLTGSGSNGKSVFLDLWKTTLGDEDFVSTVKLQDLNHRFRAAGLVGKIANIFTDLPHNALNETDAFKVVVSGETLQLERKNQDPFSYRPRAKLWFSANELPRARDRSEGFWRRWIVVPFPHHFPKDDPRRDPQLKQKLCSDTEARSYLLRLAVEGLKRLEARGEFSESTMVDRAVEDYRRQSNPMLLWLEENVVEVPEARTPKDALYEDFTEWLEDNGHKGIPAKNTFIRDLLAHFGGLITQSHPRDRDGKRVRCINGLALASDRPDPDDFRGLAQGRHRVGTGSAQDQKQASRPFVASAAQDAQVGTLFSRVRARGEEREVDTGEGGREKSHYSRTCGSDLEPVHPVPNRQPPGMKGENYPVPNLCQGESDPVPTPESTKNGSGFLPNSEMRDAIQEFCWSEVAKSKKGEVAQGRLFERFLDAHLRSEWRPDKATFLEALEGSGLEVVDGRIGFSAQKAASTPADPDDFEVF